MISIGNKRSPDIVLPQSFLVKGVVYSISLVYHEGVESILSLAGMIGIMVIVPYITWKVIAHQEKHPTDALEIVLHPETQPSITTAPGTDPKMRNFYGKKDYLLSVPELTFFHLLNSLYSEKYFIFPQVKLDKLFYIKYPYKKVYEYRNKIDRKSVDFVFVSKKYLVPKLAIELDGSSHDLPERIERDGFVNQIFEETDLPLIRIPVRQYYSTTQLKDQIDTFLEPKPSQTYPN